MTKRKPAKRKSDLEQRIQMAIGCIELKRNECIRRIRRCGGTSEYIPNSRESDFAADAYNEAIAIIHRELSRKKGDYK